jgi:hypothetical protein
MRNCRVGGQLRSATNGALLLARTISDRLGRGLTVPSTTVRRVQNVLFRIALPMCGALISRMSECGDDCLLGGANGPIPGSACTGRLRFQ